MCNLSVLQLQVNWDSTLRSVMTSVLFNCAVWRMQTLYWDTARSKMFHLSNITTRRWSNRRLKMGSMAPPGFSLVSLLSLLACSLQLAVALLLAQCYRGGSSIIGSRRSADPIIERFARRATGAYPSNQQSVGECRVTAWMSWQLIAGAT